LLEVVACFASRPEVCGWELPKPPSLANSALHCIGSWLHPAACNSPKCPSDHLHMRQTCMPQQQQQQEHLTAGVPYNRCACASPRLLALLCLLRKSFLWTGYCASCTHHAFQTCCALQ
jgi:hypothetical protein